MKKKNFNKPQTLCWDCGNACNNGCSWSKELKPVAGWATEETSTGLRVIACPEFRQDDRQRNRPENFDTDGCIEMLKAAGRLMYSDYVAGEGVHKYDRDDPPETIMDAMKKNRRDIENFLLSDYGRTLMMITNPESIIEMLQKRAEAYDEAESGNLAEGR